MKHIIQTIPTVGTAAPYSLQEGLRVFGTRVYWEVEIPVPIDNRTAPPEMYLLLYLVPNGNTTLALANPPSGMNNVIEAIAAEKEYVLAFQREWPLFKDLYVDAAQVMAAFALRPVLIQLQDPDDRLQKWMVGRQVSVPPRTTNTILDVELGAMDSLVSPTLRLLTEIEAAHQRVVNGMLSGRYQFPQTRFEKFEQKYNKAMEVLDFVKTIAEAAAGK